MMKRNYSGMLIWANDNLYLKIES
ncbi:hypothetical protein BCEN4_1660008 [Burkholderia cenocepacia]|nr:hypothetical protein BCEN4_1660008 [Burkholderia cenocepacia]